MRTPSTTPSIERYVRFACYLALLALGMIAWALVRPQPLPVVAAMSVGQGIGTLSLLCFLYAVASDLRRTYSRAPEPERPAPPTK